MENTPETSKRGFASLDPDLLEHRPRHVIARMGGKATHEAVTQPPESNDEDFQPKVNGDAPPEAGTD